MTATRIHTLLTAVVVYLSVRGDFEEKSAVVLFKPPFLHLYWSGVARNHTRILPVPHKISMT